MPSNSNLNPDVVVIEDNEDDADMTLMALRRIEPNPSMVVIPDGEQALEGLLGEKRLRPRVVFLDLKLPKVHGLDVLAAMKADPQVQNIPVLIWTSSDEPRDVGRARELGCEEYMCKPIDWKEYLDLVCRNAVRYLEGCTYLAGG
jgi:two-component system, response regulator